MQSRGKTPTELTFPHVGAVRDLGLIGEGNLASVWVGRVEGANAGEPSQVEEAERDARVGVKIARESGVGSRGNLVDEVLARAAIGAGAPIDGGWIDERPALVFRWIPGKSLAEVARDELPPLQSLARQLADMLARLHSMGLRHGDVKPDNIVVHEGVASLIDFGLVAKFGLPLHGGTRGYLAPEALAGGAVGPEADVWALAETLAATAARAGLAWPIDAAWSSAASASAGERPSAARLAGWERHGGRVPPSSAYVMVRAKEWLAAAKRGDAPPDGRARDFLLGAMRAVAGLMGLRAEGRALPPLDRAGRASLLSLLAGAGAEHWVLPHTLDDESAFLDALHAASARGGVYSVADLVSASEVMSMSAALARLAAAPDEERALRSLEAAALDEGAALEADVAEAATAVLRRAGKLQAAQRLAERRLARAADRSAVIDAAMLDRLMGRAEAAERRLSALSVGGSEPRSADHRALVARLAIDRGDLARAGDALAHLPSDDADADAALAEPRALLEWSRGHFDAGLEVLDQTRELDPERRARRELVRGMLLHGRGDALAALRAFTRAADTALAMASPPLEASARASAAAAARDAGRLGEALEAADRAIALLERAGRTRDAGRARLNRASVLVALGAFGEARAEAGRALSSARSAADALGAIYAAWILVDARDGAQPVADADREALLAAHRDASNPSLDDRLRMRAYEAMSGAIAAERLTTPDEERAATPETLATLVRARLVCLSAGPELQAALEAVLRQDDRALPAELAGATLLLAQKHARSLARGELAARVTERLRALADRLESDVPPAYRASFDALGWVAAARVPNTAPAESLAPGQVELLARIARSLRDRTSLSDLLRQVVDGLVLWLGVERGVLLLRAPGEVGHATRLVPRFGRGLAREDLAGEQLQLSMTLASRALESGEPVVAVDASGDASDASLSGSIHALRLRSVLAVPLVARGEALGVVYLDDRIRRGAFGPAEAAWVKLLATQAAAAIADARDAVRLKRLARRAERAQQRLATHLAKTEGDLEVARAALVQAGVKSKAAGDPRGTRRMYEEILGESAAMRRMLHVLDRVADAADARVPVLIVGESGTGKELVARAIHRNGPRKSKAFVAENCGAIPEPLLESTLFGHVRGAFTGADRPRVGLFEVAHGGTLLLDEVGETSAAMQAKLLRALQEGEIRPVGGEQSKKVDVRVVAATHRDLGEMVESGRFREDLFYRLAVVTIHVPALRERAEDIPQLVEYFVRKYAGDRSVRVTRRALAALAAAPWPGNVRQLENELRRALVLCEEVLDVEHLSDAVGNLAGRGGREGQLTLRDHVDALERRLVGDALRRAAGNQTHAAKALGVSRFGLQKMMRRLGLGAAGAPGARGAGGAPGAAS